MKVRHNILLVFVCFFFFSSPVYSSDAVEEVNKDVRCTVCGMFVAKYPAWITKVVHKDKSILYFDGVKDMMAYVLEPEKYGSTPTNSIVEVHVKDYYSLKWQNGHDAFFVKGSDVYGPMGHELIPFSTNEAAASFTKDHHGKSTLKYQEITLDLINEMRSGHRMK